MGHDDDHAAIEQPAPFNPLDYLAGIQKPARYDVPSGWLGHVPFAMTLVAMTSPRVIVELGTHWGVSYCAFCQAVAASGSRTRCFAVDTWRGDKHTDPYTNHIHDDLQAHHDPLYGSFSTLLRSMFDEALPRFADASIDILHIDGFHTYEAVKHDFETWLPKLSDRAIVLFHDTDVRDKPTFGVWRFWDEVKARYPSFQFSHSHGLGVLAVGPDIPTAARSFFDAPAGLKKGLQDYFRHQGDQLCEIRDLEDAVKAGSAENGQLNARLTDGIRTDRFRYRAVDALADLVDKVPVVPRALRSIARAALRPRAR